MSDARARMEKNLGDAPAVDGLRFHVIDVGNDGGERALVGGCDALLHFLGAQARVIP